MAAQFFRAYTDIFPLKTLHTAYLPQSMLNLPVDEVGWVDWKIIDGTLNAEQYRKLESDYKVQFPYSFVEWHKAYFFLDGDCSLLRLPISNPLFPLQDIVKGLEWFIPQQLIPQKIYPFAYEGNDAGPLVFDGRKSVKGNEFPIRLHDQEYGGSLDGLSEVIFSSFPKLLECITHYMKELKEREGFEIIPDFFKIDPFGAGKTGVDYWLDWVEMLG